MQGNILDNQNGKHKSNKTNCLSKIFCDFFSNSLQQKRDIIFIEYFTSFIVLKIIWSLLLLLSMVFLPIIRKVLPIPTTGISSISGTIGTIFFRIFLFRWCSSFIVLKIIWSLLLLLLSMVFLPIIRPVLPIPSTGISSISGIIGTIFFRIFLCRWCSW